MSFDAALFINKCMQRYREVFPAEAACDVPAPIAEDVEVCCANCGDKGCDYCGPAALNFDSALHRLGKD